MTMERITTPERLRELAQRLGVSFDWHEPDQQGLTARVAGRSFDNTGFWPDNGFRAPESLELHAILSRDGRDFAVVNLADLFAWASRSAS